MTEIANMLWVAGGGALGAFARFWISAWAAARIGKNFPYGTLSANVLGCFLMGLVAGLLQTALIPNIPWRDFLAEGFLGALTTFSTFSMDTFAAFRDGQPGKGVLNAVLNVVLCLCAVTLGFFIIQH